MDAWRSVILDAWKAGRALSAVGPGPVEAHLRHAEGLADLIPPAATSGIDLGTGIGIPGLALAGLRPEMRWTLLDASQRRVRLVQETIARLGWADRVTAVHGRSEDRGLGLSPASVVVARLFGPPPVTAECAAPLVAVGGVVLISDLDEVGAESRWPAMSLEPLGLVPAGRRADPAVQILACAQPHEDRFPRKPGVARKRPLW